MGRLHFLITFFALVSTVESFIPFLTLFGPNTPTVNFKGRITENGLPVSAYISLDVLYNIDGDLVPITLVQTNSISNYEIHLSGLAFKDERITNHAILRVQALSVNGGSASVRINLQDLKVLYQNNVELGHKRVLQLNQANPIRSLHSILFPAYSGY